MSRPVRLYFDFISPYSYLALTQAESFAAEHGVTWHPRPILYAAVLEARGLIGPAEEPVKRRYTMNDIVRAADLLDVPLIGPPAHPFRSLEALRATALHQADPRALTLAVALATACWGEGRDLADVAVVAGVVDAMGIDSDDLDHRLREPEAKANLKRNTDEALAAGVFGVPTFELEGELFWGHDRYPHLAARLMGHLNPTADRARILDGRPRAIDRPGVRERFRSTE
jgi:2-hydroxychromene-2-carboxylate isomerase